MPRRDGGAMGTDKTELAVLARLFAPAVFRELGRSGESPLFSRLIRQSRIPSDRGSLPTVGAAFERAFQILRTLGMRDEYVYRSAIIQKVVLGRHSLRTASVLNEARAGVCRADLVVLNGTSTAYEIKSERDSLARLANQLENYRRVFATVNVLASPSHVPHVLAVAPEDVGVLALSSRYTIHTVRAALNVPERTSPLAILDALRANEAVSILDALGIDRPLVANTRLRTVLKEAFAGLDPAVVHNQMVQTLRSSRSHVSIETYIADLPASVRAAVLSGNLSSHSRSLVRQAIETPLDAALTWS